MDTALLSWAQNLAVSVNSQIEPDKLVSEVIQNERQARIDDLSHWRFRDLKEKDGRKELRDVIETKDGSIDRLLAVNDEPLTPSKARWRIRASRNCWPILAKFGNGSRNRMKTMKKKASFSNHSPAPSLISMRAWMETLLDYDLRQTRSSVPPRAKGKSSTTWKAQCGSMFTRSALQE
jgi:hypothetical protein